MVKLLIKSYNCSIIRVLARLSALFTLLLFSTSCKDIVVSPGSFISSSGTGELIIEGETAVSIDKMALVVCDSLHTLHILGSGSTISSEGALQGKGASLIIDIPLVVYSTSLLISSYLVDSLCGVCYTTHFDDALDQSEYIEVESGMLIIRQSSSVYDLQLLGVDTYGGNVLLSYTGYLYRTIVL